MSPVVVVTVDGVVALLQTSNWHKIIMMRWVLDIGGGLAGYYGGIQLMQHQLGGVMMARFFSPTRALLSLNREHHCNNNNNIQPCLFLFHKPTSQCGWQ